MRHHQRGLAVLGDDVRHGKRLAGAGNSQQRLICSSLTQPLNELLDRLGLVAGGLKRTDKLKRRHEDRTSLERNRIATLLLFTLDGGCQPQSEVPFEKTQRPGKVFATQAEPARHVPAVALW